MRSEVEPSADIEKLVENLDQRFRSAEKKGDTVEVELDEASDLKRVPGVDSYTDKEQEEVEGIGGRPVGERAYARVDSREDVAKAFLATVDGHDLVLLNSQRQWDLRLLRRYNPKIKNLKSDEPVEELGIEKGLEIQGVKDVEIDITEKEVDQVYRFIQP